MALSDQMIGDGLVAWLNFHGQTVTMSSGHDAGKPFTATMVVAPDAKISGEVVQDNRELSIIVFANSSWPSKSLPGDFLVDENGQKWKLGKRTNNPVDVTVDFEVIKQTN
jgi:hypothetical protein